MDYKALQKRIDELAQPIKEDNIRTMPFGEAIYQYVDEEESSGDARLYLDGKRLVDDVRYYVEEDNPDVEVIALSESKITEEPANNTFTVDTDKIDAVDVMNINEIIADYMQQEHPDLPADAGFSYSIVVDVD
tara:strand:- start:18 stop:416 length:399 start_codon:yes stop_codon:yes gene_type:complete